MEKDLQETQTEIAEKKNDSPEKKKRNKKALAAKIVNIATGVFVVLALIFLIESLYTNKHLHNNYFGHAILPVVSNSMKLEDGKKDNFERGDVIFVKIIKDSKKKDLKVGDVITFKFYDYNTDSQQLNTHRIVEIDGSDYITRGDADTLGLSSERVAYTDVVGVYSGKIGNIGHVGLFMDTKAGLFVMIVVPFILLLGVSVFHFLKSFSAFNKHRAAEATENTLSLEKERLRQEILAEMQNKQGEGQSKEKDKSDDSATKK